MVEEKSTSGIDPESQKLYLWIKGLESKFNNLNREVRVLKEDFLRRNERLKKEVKSMDGEMLEMKLKHERFEQKMDLIIKELKKTAGKEEVDTIKKYLELWNPMNFVTQKDLERAINAQLKKGDNNDNSTGKHK
jgi:hypothetical protein